MFKLESYVTPLLLSYVDKYVKNLKPADLQLSVWQGDLVLNNLDLKLDVLEQELRLPFSFISGHIHELRIHVPWTKLGSESVIVSINTIECILKLASPDNEKVPSADFQKSESQSSLSDYKKKHQQKDSQDIPPGYIQTVVNRIMNNVSIVVTNLILKYVEDDIVLSVNVKSADCHTVNANWERSFADVTADDLCLHRVIELSDMTMCLDKRSSSGKIEIYQDPLVYKCLLTCRIQLRYDNEYAKFPSQTTVNLFCQNLEVSLTDQQLPMWIRLINLVVTMYYGQLPVQIYKQKIQQQLAETAHLKPLHMLELEEQLTTEDQGWINWAWSYVPSILPEGEDEEASSEPEMRKFTPATFQFGAYVARTVITFKLTEISQAFGASKLIFYPFIKAELECGALEIMIKGLEFSNVQIGITSGKVSSLGECLCGNKDFVNVETPALDPCFFVIGPTSSTASQYLSRSLFLNGEQSRETSLDVSLSLQEHLQKFDETTAVEKYGAFWLDYVYTLQLPDDDEEIDINDLEHSNLQEEANLRVVFSNFLATVSSNSHHRVQRFIHAANDHDYLPYHMQESDQVLVKRKQVPSTEVKKLEEFVPNRTQSLVLLNPKINFLPCDHQTCDISLKLNRQKKRSRKSASSEQKVSMHTIPLLSVTAAKFSVERCSAMYPTRVAQVASSTEKSCSSLLHHAYVHTQYNVFEASVSLSQIKGQTISELSVVIMPRWDSAFYTKNLALPVYWQTQEPPLYECQLELPHVELFLSPPQAFLLSRLLRSWTGGPNDVNIWTEDSLLADALCTQDFTRINPLIECSVLDVKCKLVCTKELFAGKIQIKMFRIGLEFKDNGKDCLLPVLHGPAKTEDLRCADSLVAENEDSYSAIDEYCLSSLIQFPSVENREISGLCNLKLLGVIYCLDPTLLTCCSYRPHPITPCNETGKQVHLRIFKEEKATADKSDTNRTAGSCLSNSMMLSKTTPTPTKTTTGPLTVDNSTPVSHGRWFREKLFTCYPLLKSLVVQVDILPCVCFIPSAPMPALLKPRNHLTDELRLLYQSGMLPSTVVLVFPHLLAKSSGSTGFSNDFPVPAKESSGDNLPWKINLSGFNIYTLHKHHKPQYVMEPFDLTSTLAIAVKHHSGEKQSIKSLGLVVHNDAKICSFALSLKQVDLICKVAEQAHQFFLHIMENRNESSVLSLSLPIVIPTSATSVSQPGSHFTEANIEAQNTEVSVEKHKQMSSSLWMQWTVGRLSISCYGRLPSKKAFCVQMLLDDIVSSVDLQEVYQKAKLKVTMMDITHYEKSDVGQWVTGPFQGVVFTCTEKLAHNTQILNLKAGSVEASSYFPMFPPHVPYRSHGFLSMIFTRAQNKNIQKRWWADKTDSSDNCPAPAALRYVNEIDVTLQPFDFVVYMPVITRTAEIMNNVMRLAHFSMKAKNDDTGRSQMLSSGLYFTTDSLPLVYFKTNSMRIIVPELKENLKLPMEESHKTHLNKTVLTKESLPSQDVTQVDDSNNTKHNADFQNVNCSLHNAVALNCSADMLVLQLDGFSLAPQADNPLPRLTVHKDLFLKAVKAHMTQIPGSDIEDRQYQLDLCGLCISTGKWDSIVLRGLNRDNDETSSKGQNPAMEWNYGMLQKDEDYIPESIKFVPLASKFDVKLVVAPAVVHKSVVIQGIAPSAPILVCGHSIEINVTSDIDFFINVHQLALMHSVFSTNISQFVQTAETREVHRRTVTSQVLGRDTRCVSAINDSGIESEVSVQRDVQSQEYSLLTDINSSLQQAVTDDTAVKFLSTPENDHFIPFDVLLTASRVSLALYIISEPDRYHISSEVQEVLSNKRKSKKDSVPEKPCFISCPVDETPVLISTDSLVAKDSRLRYSSGDKMTDRHSSISTASLLPEDMMPMPHNEHLAGPQVPMITPLLGWAKLDHSAHDNLLPVISDELDEHNQTGMLSPIKSAESFMTAEESPVVNCVIIPILYAVLSQPHTYIQCKPTKQKIEASCYNVILRGGEEILFLDENSEKIVAAPSDYTFHWLETRQGKANPKTGLIPPFYTLTIYNFLTEDASVSVKVERPARINVGFENITRLMEHWHKIQNIPHVPFYMGNSCTTENEASSEYLNKVPSFLLNLSSIHICTAELVVSLETFPCPEQPQIVASLLSCDAKVMLNLFIESTPDEAVFSVDCDGLLVKLCFCNTWHYFLGPLSFRASIGIIWVGGLVSIKAVPLLTAIIESNIVTVRCGQEHLHCFDMVKQHLEELFKSNIDDRVNQIKLGKPSSRHLDIIQGRDDLRAGSFRYVHDTECIEMEPRPWEIVLCQHRGTMTWCYPEPRSLTRVTIHPVPFASADDEKQSGYALVSCVLQYWDPLRKIFLDYKDFTLSESSSCSLNMPNDHTQRASSNMWRVVIFNNGGNQDFAFSSENLGLSSAVLAVSMEIDSYFNPALLPTTLASINIGLLQIRLFHHMKHLGKGIPGKLQNFSFDDTSLSEQEFFLASMESTIVYCKQWLDNSQIEFSTNVGCEIVEYKNLTMLPLVESFHIQGQMELQKEMVSCNFDTDPVFIRLGQAAIHSISAAKELWNSASNIEDDQVVLNAYIVCNDTQETILFGQASTDEIITLCSRKMHAYSWRSHKVKQELRFSLDGMGGNWSTGFSIDKLGNFVAEILCEDITKILIVKIRQLTNFQKQIIVFGELILSNRLTQQLEVDIRYHNSENIQPAWKYCCLPLLQKSSLPSCVLQNDVDVVLKVRLLRFDTDWSHSVQLNDVEGEPQLVKVPLVEKGSFIHIWCQMIKQKFGDIFQKLVLFTPLFVVRTHLPLSLTMNIHTPRIKTTQRIELEGQGREHQLWPVGGELTHSVTFQLAPQLKPSAPTLPLSVGMIEQVPRLPLENPDIDHLCQSWQSDYELLWPYNSADKERYIKQLRECCYSLPQRTAIVEFYLEQPDIELAVDMSQHWPGCNTLLMDVKPWCLIINDTDYPLVISCNINAEWTIPSSQVLAPPRFENTFRIGLPRGDEMFYSDPLFLSEEEDQSLRYHPAIQGVLCKQGYTHTTLYMCNSAKVQCCYFTLQSTMKHGIRLVTVTSRVAIVNMVEYDLYVRTYAIPNTTEKVDVQTLDSYPTCLSAFREKLAILHYLLLWDMPAKELDDQVPGLYNSLTLYLSLSHGEWESYHPTSYTSHVSYPLRLNLDCDSRQVLAVPYLDSSSSKGLKTRCYSVSVQLFEGVVYVMIDNEDFPDLLLYNNCSFLLNYGQCMTPPVKGLTVQEESELIAQLPIIIPKSSAHYSFSLLSKKFPEISPVQKPQLHLGQQKDDMLYWSSGISIEEEHDQLVTIPNCCDVKIHLEKFGHTMHIFIDSVTRAEVSAKEIRSRFTTTVVREETDKQPISFHSYKEEIENEQDKSLQFPKADLPQSKHILKMIDLSIFLQQCCFILLDNVTFSSYNREIARVSMTHLLLAYSPNKVKSISPNKKLNMTECNLLICVENLQIDNQMIGQGNFDFPVILMRQNDGTGQSYCKESELLVPAQRFALLRKKSLVVFHSVLQVEEKLCLMSLVLELKPMSVFLEDTFIFDVLHMVDSFIPTRTYNPNQNFNCRSLPSIVQYTSTCLRQPIRLQMLSLSSLSLLVSIHASLKLFLASHSTPLTFAAFERRDFCTTPKQLINAILSHYVTSTVLRAGLVVGSLDLLGNPTCLLREVGCGMADFVRLPYEAISGGPGSFIRGVSQGASSLLRHISAGTLTSMTNFASSFSRNMDRLSLDEDHFIRQEANRRHKPDHFSAGLKQGLTGFCISLLGAVAGMVDQPLQTISHSSAQLSASTAMTGIVSGMGKGLVGVVTKPLGGAAELFSQAGQGLLRDIGWEKLPYPCYNSVIYPVSEFPNATVKYPWKMFQTLNNAEVVCIVEASQIVASGLSPTVYLLLTPEALFIISQAEDNQQQAFAISGIHCEGAKTDDNFLHVFPVNERGKLNSEAEEQAKDRVAEFVDKVSVFTLAYNNQSETSSTCSMTSQINQPKQGLYRFHQSSNTYTFSMDTRLRELFLSLFVYAQQLESGNSLFS